MIEHQCTSLCHVQLTNMDLPNVARVATVSTEALFTIGQKLFVSHTNKYFCLL